MEWVAHYDKIVQDKMRLREKSLLCLDIIERNVLSVEKEKEIERIRAETGIEAAENFFRVYENFSQKLLGIKLIRKSLVDAEMKENGIILEKALAPAISDTSVNKIVVEMQEHISYVAGEAEKVRDFGWVEDGLGVILEKIQAFLTEKKNDIAPRRPSMTNEATSCKEE